MDYKTVIYGYTFFSLCEVADSYMHIKSKSFGDNLSLISHHNLQVPRVSCLHGTPLPHHGQEPLYRS